MVALFLTHQSAFFMLKITTLNVNGIRAAAQKGLFQWLQSEDADIICLQETRAFLHQLPQEVSLLENFYSEFSIAQKPGYSGVAIFSKQKPVDTLKTLDFPLIDNEGRYLEFNFPNFTIASVYFPSGTSGTERQNQKFAFLDFFLPHLQKLADQKKTVILCGDWNIAHKPIDLKNWKSNQKNSGFLPEERSWFDTLFNQLHFVDAFRALNSEADQYTWWSTRGRARENNVGWRIDYQIITPNLKEKLLTTEIYKNQRFSDHAPLTFTYDLDWT